MNISCDIDSIVICDCLQLSVLSVYVAGEVNDTTIQTVWSQSKHQISTCSIALTLYCICDCIDAIEHVELGHGWYIHAHSKLSYRTCEY